MPDYQDKEPGDTPDRFINRIGELRTQIVTGLLAIVFSVAGYWIGTSFSSAKKDDRPQQ